MNPNITFFKSDKKTQSNDIKINMTFIMKTDPEPQNYRPAAPCVNHTLAKMLVWPPLYNTMACLFCTGRTHITEKPASVAVETLNCLTKFTIWIYIFILNVKNVGPIVNKRQKTNI